MAEEDNNDSEYEGDDGLWPWEEAAENLVRNALATMEQDEDEGVIRMEIDGREHEFDDFDELREALVHEADSGMAARAPFEDGAPVFSLESDDIVDRILYEAKIEDLFDSGSPQPDENQLLLTFEDLFEQQQVRIDLESINEELIRYLKRHPEKMRELEPRKFEELVAELFRDLGYDVELTP